MTKNKLLQADKRQANIATQEIQLPVVKIYEPRYGRMRLRGECCLPEGMGSFSRKIDSALPGSHTRDIYEEWTWKERPTLAQLRPDMARLNGYLCLTKAVPSE